VGRASANCGARLREARAASLHLGAGGRAIRRLRRLRRRQHPGARRPAARVCAPARCAAARTEERGARRAGGAARRVLHLRGLRARRPRVLPAAIGTRGGGGDAGGGLRPERHRAPCALCLYARDGGYRGSGPADQTLCCFRAFCLRNSSRARSANTLVEYWPLGSSNAPAYICSAASVSWQRRWYSRRIWAPTWMFTSGSSSASSPPRSASLSRWYFGMTCIRPLAPTRLSATGL